MEKLLIIDGMNLLFQMFYGMPSQILNRDGRAIQGTIGFVGALLRMIRMVQPGYVLVVFDGETHNPRKDLDEDYKANRPDYKDMDENEIPFSQLSDIYAALDFLGICHRDTCDCEADDWIAGYVRQYSDRFHITVASQDSDFFQLIDDHVHILRYRGDNTVVCNRLWLMNKYGIHPEQYAAFKAMTGDSADNIRGVDKVGPKTAAWLLQTYGSLEGIIENAEQISKPSIRKSVGESRERLMKNMELICLSGCCCLPFQPEELRWQYKGQSSYQVLSAIKLY